MTRRRLAEALAILLCFVVIAVANAHQREDAPGVRWITGAPGQTINSRPFDLTVTSVTLTNTASYSSTELTSEGTLIVVEWSASVWHTRSLLSEITLHTESGRILDPRGEFLYTAGPAATDPGFTMHATSVFQVEDGDTVGADFVLGFDRGFAYTYTGALRVENIVDSATPRVGSVELRESVQEVTR